jgi:Lon protease-like protein
MTTPPLDLSSLPLFPLSEVLFPGAVLRLRIFEVRYLDMIKKQHLANLPFGVVTLKTGSEVAKAPSLNPQQTPVKDTFFEVGTLALITQLTQVQPGLLEVICEAGERFVVDNAKQLATGLWMGQTFEFAPDVKVKIPSDLQNISDALQMVVNKLSQQNQEVNTLPFASPYYFEDCAWVANRWCQFLRVPTELRQRLMQLDNPLMRLELVGDLLRRQGIIS